MGRKSGPKSSKKASKKAGAVSVTRIGEGSVAADGGLSQTGAVTEGFSLVERTRKLTGPVIGVDDVVVEAPDSTRHERQVVVHPGAVSVVPVDRDGSVVMVRQYRVAVDDVLLEIPAGKRDVAGEDPAETARRELAEEVGKSPGTLVRLAEFHNSPGFTDEHSVVYLATDLSDVPTAHQGVEENYLEVVSVTLEDVPDLVMAGVIRDAKSIIGLLLAREHLNG